MKRFGPRSWRRDRSPPPGGPRPVRGKGEQGVEPSLELPWRVGGKPVGDQQQSGLERPALEAPGVEHLGDAKGCAHIVPTALHMLQRAPAQPHHGPAPRCATEASAKVSTRTITWAFSCSCSQATRWADPAIAKSALHLSPPSARAVGRS